MRLSAGGTAYELAWRAVSPRLQDYANFVRALAANDLREERDR